MAQPPTSTGAAGAPEVRVRLRISVAGVVAIGPGKVALLEAVHRHGSITAAARSLEMSYRRAWLLLDELNRSLRAPAIATAQGGVRGGGAVLTPTGEAVIENYRSAEATALRAGKAPIDRLLRLMKRP